VGGATEHLRKRVEELESDLEERARFLAQREARLRDLEERVERVAAECFNIAQAFVESTEQPILLQLHRKIGPARFRIRAGASYSVVARLTDDRWDVVAHLRSGIRPAAFTTDQEFVQAASTLLEELIGDALVTLMVGRDLLAPVAASRPKESFRVPWQRMFGARPGHRTA
jgi:hypothetical protein